MEPARPAVRRVNAVPKPQSNARMRSLWPLARGLLRLVTQGCSQPLLLSQCQDRDGIVSFGVRPRRRGLACAYDARSANATARPDRLPSPSLRASRTLVVVLALVAITAGVVAGVLVAADGHATSGGSNRTSKQAMDPGIPISGSAPDFTLTDQFGRRVSLHAFRGRVAILAFIDPVCTTICPLTTAAMTAAKAMLGPAAARVQLLGVAANPTVTAVKSVRAYSEAHGMMQEWRFLTAPLPRLKEVWGAYGIKAQLVHGQIDHTAALYVIGARGRVGVGTLGSRRCAAAAARTCQS